MNDDEKVVSLSSARDREKSPEKTQEKTTEKQNVNEPVICSFCGRPNYLVVKMIKGPGVNICSECVMVCVQYFMLEDKMTSPEAQRVLDAFWKGSKQ